MKKLNDKSKRRCINPSCLEDYSIFYLRKQTIRNFLYFKFVSKNRKKSSNCRDGINGKCPKCVFNKVCIYSPNKKFHKEKKTLNN